MQFAGCILELPADHLRFAFHSKENEVARHATRRIVHELPADPLGFAFHGKENEAAKHATRRILLKFPADHFRLGFRSDRQPGRKRMVIQPLHKSLENLKWPMICVAPQKLAV